MKEISIIKRIQWVVEDFLEKYDKIGLPKNEETAQILLQKIEKYLLPEKTKLKREIVKDVEYQYKGKKVANLFGSLEKPQKNYASEVSRWYDDLHPIWQNLKENIKLKRMNMLGLGKINSSDIRVDFNESRIHFKRIVAFLDLLEDIPFNCFRECEYEKCYKWFITTQKNKRYCSEGCARIIRQNKQKEKDPDAYKEYHRTKQKEYYRKKCGLPITKS